MKFEDVYFINGTAYAGKSTMVHLLAEKHGGVECGENYHDALLPELDPREFPGLTYTRDLEDWHDFGARRRNTRRGSTAHRRSAKRWSCAS